MATLIRTPTEGVIWVVRPGEDIGEDLYVVVWNIDLANFIDRPEAVFALDEWRSKPESIRRCYRTVVYRAKDPLDAFTEALKEQTNVT